MGGGNKDGKAVLPTRRYDEAERPQEQGPVEVSDPGETGRGRNEGSRDLLNKDRWR